MLPHGVSHLDILCLHKDMIGAETDGRTILSQDMLLSTSEQNRGHLPSPVILT